MDAFQYFYKDGQPIGRAPTGQLSLDTADRGSQWSYNDFATYQVFDEAMTPVTPVQGLSFCLQSSSAIDLTVKGATWQPANDTLASSCATAGALWTREVLDSGWGSTNYSYRSGQSFDITNLPNGHYFVKIQANPNGTILERNLQNDSATRAIIIKGRPGHRTVVALPYHNVYAP
jgi:hypothetical protein